MGSDMLFICLAVSLHLRLFSVIGMQDLKFTKPSYITGVQNNRIKYII